MQLATRKGEREIEAGRQAGRQADEILLCPSTKLKKKKLYGNISDFWRPFNSVSS